jgi:hypothetical protein
MPSPPARTVGSGASSFTKPSRARSRCAFFALIAASTVVPRAARAEDPSAPLAPPAATVTPASPEATPGAPSASAPEVSPPSASAAETEPPPIPVTPESAPPADEPPPRPAATSGGFRLVAGGRPARDTVSASSTKRGGGIGVFIAAGLGFAVGRVSDAHLAEKRLQGPLLELHAGVSLNRQWSVGFGVSSVEMPVVRTDAGVFVPSAGGIFAAPIQVQAKCSSCKEPLEGGVVTRMPLNVLTLGPEAQFRPLGESGPFVGALTGLAAMPQLTGSIGGAFVARAGYRLEFARVLAASVQAGVDGQVYSGGSAVFPFAGVQLEAFIAGK